MEKNMKRLLATVAILGMATAAQAAEYATITKITPNYQNVSVPQYRTDCRMNEVPIYGRSGQASTGDTVFGAIIGGALGNQVGGGSGKDAMTVLGAIIGADVANKKGGQELKNYTIRYEWNGIVGKTVTYNNYRVGDRLPIRVSIQAK